MPYRLYLWEDIDVKEWQAALDAMTERMPKLGKPELDDLESWFFGELPKQIKEAEEPCMNSSQLVKTMEWKLKRGKWRPRLLDMVKKHSDGVVISTTKRAYEAAKSGSRGSKAEYQETVKQAVNILLKLNGVGAATASAVLTAYDPAFPFMSDEGLAAATGKANDYSLKKYLEYATALWDKANELSKKGQRTWTAQEVEQALWSDFMQNAPNSKKRKR